MVLFLVLSYMFCTVQSQDPHTCRSMAMDCLVECFSDCDATDGTCRASCKPACVNKYTCPNTRDLWSSEHTSWCCACEGVRCGLSSG